MLFLSPSLLLGASPALGLHLPIILWRNLATIGNIAADEEVEDYPATNLVNPVTTSLWKSGATSEQLITIDINSADPVDGVGIARHNFGSGGVTVSIEGLTAEPEADWEELFPETLIGNDDPVLFRFEKAFLIGLRVRLQPADVEPQAAVLYVGEVLTLEWGVQVGHTPLPYARERDIVVGRSESGEFLGRIQTGGARRSRAEIANLSPAFYREHVDPFFAQSPPFFFAWAPLAYPGEVGFAWLTNDPVPVPSHLAGYINITLELEGIAL